MNEVMHTYYFQASNYQYLPDRPELAHENESVASILDKITGTLFYPPRKILFFHYLSIKSHAAQAMRKMVLDEIILDYSLLDSDPFP